MGGYGEGGGGVCHGGYYFVESCGESRRLHLWLSTHSICVWKDSSPMRMFSQLLQPRDYDIRAAMSALFSFKFRVE